MRYGISNEFLTAEFSTLGGELLSIRRAGLEYLWQGDKTYWGGRAPVLFPIVGTLRNGRAVTKSGKICRMNRHGIARKREFALKSLERDSISFQFCSDLETKGQYPFDFTLELHYQMRESSLLIQYTVSNPGREILPFQIGGHPGFRCPIGGKEKFEDYHLKFEFPETATCPMLNPETGLVELEKRREILKNESVLQMSHELFTEDALIFDALRSRKVCLCNPKTGRGVRIHFKDFDYFLVWSSANGGPFVALEPWTGLATCSDESDVFENKRGIVLLQPGQAQSFRFTIDLF